MADFEILIKTEGASTAAKDIDKVSAATSEATKATKAHGAETELLSAKKSKLIAGFKALGHEIPIIGALIRAAKNPFTLLGFGIAAVVAVVYQFIESINAMAKEIRKFDSINLALRNWQEVAAQAAASNREFAASITAIVKSTETVEEKFNKTKDIISKTFGVESQLAEKNKVLELAQVDKEVAAGRMSPAQGAAVKAGIENRYGAEAQDRSEREIAARQNAAAIANKQAAEDRAKAENELPGLNAKMAEARRKLQSRQAFLAAKESTAGADREKILTARENEEGNLGGVFGFIRRQLGQLSPDEQLKAHDLEMDQARAAVINAQSGFDAASAARNAARGRVTGAVTSQLNTFRAFGEEGANLSRARGAGALFGPIDTATRATNVEGEMAKEALENAKQQAAKNEELLRSILGTQHISIELQQTAFRESARLRAEMEKLQNQMRNNK